MSLRPLKGIHGMQDLLPLLDLPGELVLWVLTNTSLIETREIRHVPLKVAGQVPIDKLLCPFVLRF
jgi:hypothetical protein